MCLKSVWLVDQTCYVPADTDEFHILHIIPSQQPEVISGLGGISGMDAIVTAKPDPGADQQHVSLF